MQQTPTDHERIVVLEQLFSEQNKKIDKIQETLEVMQTKLFNGYFDKKITDKIKVVLAEFKDDVFDNMEDKIAREVNTQIRAEIGTLALKVLIAGVSSGAFIQFIINWLSKWGDNGMTYSVASFPELDELILVPIGDFHVGSPYFLEKKLDKIINFVENTEQAYLLLLIATSLLGYEDYAQRRGLQPPSHTLSLIRLSGLTKDIQFNLQSL